LASDDLGLDQDLDDAVHRGAIVLDHGAGLACLRVGQALDRLGRLALFDAEVAKAICLISFERAAMMCLSARHSAAPRCRL